MLAYYITVSSADQSKFASTTRQRIANLVVSSGVVFATVARGSKQVQSFVAYNYTEKVFFFFP